MTIYTAAKSIPLLRKTVRAVRSLPGINKLWHIAFRGSTLHWDRHYARGGDSGPGSYGESAHYKAKLVNEFIRLHAIRSVVEFGCGDGNQASMLQVERYVGLDVSKVAIERCIVRHSVDPTKSFFWYDPDRFHDPVGIFRADCAMSLDVIFHLVEDRVFERYMHNLFHSARRFVLIYNPDDEDRNNRRDPTVRSRKYSEFAAITFRQFRAVQHLPPPHASHHADFYAFERVFE